MCPAIEEREAGGDGSEPAHTPKLYVIWKAVLLLCGIPS